MYHPKSSCTYQVCLKVVRWTKNIWKLYLTAHLLPYIIFKRNELVKRPFDTILTIFKGFSKSMSYILTHAVGTQLCFCLVKKLRPTPKPLLFGSVFLPLTGSIFWELGSRSEETALYIIPRFLDLAWNYIKKKKLVQHNFPYF